jgi:hypothetical protein
VDILYEQEKPEERNLFKNGGEYYLACPAVLAGSSAPKKIAYSYFLCERNRGAKRMAKVYSEAASTQTVQSNEEHYDSRSASWFPVKLI